MGNLMSTYEDEDWAVQAGQIAGRSRIPTAKAEKKNKMEKRRYFTPLQVAFVQTGGRTPLKSKRIRNKNGHHREWTKVLQLGGGGIFLILSLFPTSFPFSLLSFAEFLFSIFICFLFFCPYFQLIFYFYFSLWRDTAAGITTRLLPRVRVLAGTRNFSVLQNVEIVSCPVGTWRSLSVGVNCLILLPSNVEFKTACSYTSILVCLRDVEHNSITCSFPTLFILSTRSVL